MKVINRIVGGSRGKALDWKLEVNGADRLILTCNDETVLVAYGDGGCTFHVDILKGLGLEVTVME